MTKPREIADFPNPGSLDGANLQDASVTANKLALGAIDASSVAYTHAGTGAVARTVEAVLDQTFSVKDFGAIGNGTDDDAPAIRATIAAAIAAGGGTILFPPGTYSLQTFDPTPSPTAHFQLVDCDGLKFSGYGANLNSTSTVSSYVFYLNGARRIAFEGFSIDGQFARSGSTITTQSIGAFYLASTTRDSESISIKDVRLTDAYFFLISSATAPYTTRVRNVLVENCLYINGYYGLNFQNNCDNFTAINFRTLNMVRTYFPYGVDNHNVEYISLNHDTFTDCLIKAYQLDTTNITVKARIINNSDPDDAQCTIESQHNPSTQPTPAKLRNITVHFDDTGTASSKSIRFAYYQDTPTPVQTPTVATQIFDNIVISGTAVNDFDVAVVQTPAGSLDISDLNVLTGTPTQIWNNKGFFGIDSTKLRFLQSGTGAQSRTIQAKLRDVASVKDFGAVGDGVTDDTAAVQAAIDATYGKSLYWPSGKYKCGQLYVYNSIDWIGDSFGLNPTSYSTDSARIEFNSLVPNGQAGITVCDGTNPIIGLSIRGLGFFGNTAIQCFNIGVSLASSLYDASFRDINIYNFGTGLVTQFFYGGLFENVRIQNCTNGMTLNSQTNAIHFNRCAIVSISQTAISHINCEGIQYSSCDISNLLKATAPITFFQSYAHFTHCYFENVTSSQVMIVGAASEVATSSTVVIDNSSKFAGDVVTANSNAYVEIRGRGIGGGGNIVGFSPTTAYVGGTVAGNNTIIENDTFIEKFPAGILPKWSAYAGGILSYAPKRGYITCTNSGAGATSGAWLALNNLAVGELYTLSVAIREGAGGLTTAPVLDLLPGTQSLPYDAAGSQAQVRNYTFRAASASLALRWGGELDLFGYTLQKGNLRTYDLDSFSTAVDTAKRYIGEAEAAPSSGTWVNGDILYNPTPIAGEPVGFICISSGTPGSWRQLAPLPALGGSAGRPSLGSNDIGVLYLDTDLSAGGQPIWWTGTSWVDATGATV